MATDPSAGARPTLLVATTPFVAGYRVAETRGQVFGLVVRSRGLAGNVAAGVDHRFHDVEEDLRVLVFWAPPHGRG